MKPMASVNAWPQAKTDRMLEIYDDDPTHETIAEIAAEYGVSMPTIRARLNRHGRFARVFTAATPRKDPWPNLPADSFKGFTREDVALAAWLEMAVRG